MAGIALAIDHPIGGRLPTQACQMSGVSFERSFFCDAPLLECEYALRVDAEGRVDAVAPAIELVDPRMVSPGAPNGYAIVADNSLGTAIVLGAPTPIADAEHSMHESISLQCGAEQLAVGSASAVLGGLEASAAWLSNMSACEVVRWLQGLGASPVPARG